MNLLDYLTPCDINIIDKKAYPLHSSSNIVGYIAKNGDNVKYSQDDFVLNIYKNNKLISSYKINSNIFFLCFINDDNYGFEKEFPENENDAKLINKIYNNEHFKKEDLVNIDKKLIKEELYIAINDDMNENEDMSIQKENMKMLED